MMKLTSGSTHFQTANPSKPRNRSVNSDIEPKNSGRKLKNSGGGGDGTRLRRRSRTPFGKRSRPDTPFLKWKAEHAAACVQDNLHGGGGCRRDVRKVSVRKFGALLWRLQFQDVASGGLGFQLGDSRVGVPFLTHYHGEVYESEANDLLHSPKSINGAKDGFSCKLESSLKFSSFMMEAATKWDQLFPEPLNEDQVYGHGKHIDEQVTFIPMVSALEAELEQARLQIQELESERRASKKKIKHFLRKVSEERAAWRSREHQEIHAFIDDLKADLNHKRKNRQSLEIVNSKLINELTEVELSAKHFLHDYEKERKTRELTEEVCDELAKEIGDEKAELEALKREAANFQEDVEEGRKMLQMAEVWREERVQMKLVDAKVALEEKYSQMNMIVGQLEAFLKSRSTPPDVKQLQKADSLGHAAVSVDIQDIKEFTPEPPNPEIFSVFEDVNIGQCSEKEIKACDTYSPASNTSKSHVATPEVNMIKESFQRHSNAFSDRNEETEDDGSGWETVSHLEDQGLCYSPEGSTMSMNKNHRNSNLTNVTASGTELERNVDRDPPITDISEIFSIPTKQFKKPSIGQLWRSRSNNINNNCKVISRLSNGRMSNASIASVDHGSGKGGLSPPVMVGFCNSPNSGNSHLARGKTGCIEWPRGMQKNNLKAKILEVRMRGQKVQLRQVLKQKY